MARYFFHVRNSDTFKDEVGRRFSNREHAKAHAAVIANELAEDDDWHGYAVVVIDEEEPRLRASLDNKGVPDNQHGGSRIRLGSWFGGADPSFPISRAIRPSNTDLRSSDYGEAHRFCKRLNAEPT
jgi:hypothetical protein